MEIKKHKRGDVREDGLVFLKYDHGRETWLSREDFERRRQALSAGSAAYQRKRWAEDPDGCRARAREYVSANRKRVNERSREYARANPKLVQARIADWRKRQCAQGASSSRTVVLRARLWFTLFTEYKTERTTRFMKAVGVNTRAELRALYEAKFHSGMTWANYGSKWQSDHIVPCALFDTREDDQVRACFHHANLRPALKEDNMHKGDNLDVEAAVTVVRALPEDRREAFLVALEKQVPDIRTRAFPPAAAPQ